MANHVVNSYLENLLRYHHYEEPVAGSANRSYAIAGPSIVPYPLLLGGGGRSTVVVNSGGGDNVGAIRLNRQHQLEDRESARGTTAAVVGGLGMIALAGTSAYFLKEFSQDRAELKNARLFREQRLGYLDVHIQQELGPILDKHIEVCENKVRKTRNILILTGAMFACAIAAFAGGMLSAPWLITAALIAGVVVASAGVFAIVWHWNDETALSQEQLRQISRMRAERL